MDPVWFKHYPPGVPHTIDPDQYVSLVALLDESFQKFKERPAYHFMGKTLSFGEVDTLSRAFAAYLQALGLVKGDRVAVMMPNVPQYPVAVAGILRAGLTLVNVNPLYTPRELEHQLKDSGAKAIVIIENFAATLQAVLAEVPTKKVILASMGDLLGLPKGMVVNYVVRKRQEDGAGLQPARRDPLQRRAGHGPRRHASRRRPSRATTSRCCSTPAAPPACRKGAVLKHRNIIANVLQSEAWNEPGDEEDPGRRADHHDLRAAAVSHLRVHGEHDADACASAAPTC